MLLAMKCVHMYKHEDLQIFVNKFNKYEFSATWKLCENRSETQLQVGENSNKLP